jgi:hypothetical protein
MKNITFSADPNLIERARTRARQQKKTLNEAFREWLERYVGGQHGGDEYRQLIAAWITCARAENSAGMR